MKKKDFYKKTLTKQSAKYFLKTLYGFTDKQADDYLKALKGKYTVTNIMYAEIENSKL